MERINSFRVRKQREVDREMAERETRAKLRKAIDQEGFVLQGYEAEAGLLDGQQAAKAAAAATQSRSAELEGREANGGSSAQGEKAAAGGYWVAQLQALGGRAKDRLDRGRMRIAHRRAQSLGASPLSEPGSA
jgi:hypothetical protein